MIYLYINAELKSKFEHLLRNTKGSYISKDFDMKQAKVGLYGRKSQNELKTTSISVQSQMNLLDNYVDTHELKVYGRYIDDGVSGQTLRRAGLLELLNDVKEGKINFILFTKIDRWTRKLFHYHKVQEILDEYGVQWKAIQEDYDTFTANGQFQIQIMILCAELEAKRATERINNVFQYKILNKEPLTGSITRGYKIEDKKHIIDEKGAEEVQMFFDKYEQIQSISKLCKYLSDRGFKISQISLKRLLSNTRYIGLYEHDVYGTIDDYFPSIIDKDQFERVQRLLSSNSRNMKEISNIDPVFRKLITCHKCGYKLSGATRKYSSGKKTVEYCCPNFKHGRGCDNGKRIQEHIIEKQFLDMLPSELNKVKVEFQKEQKKEPQIDRKKLEQKLINNKELYQEAEITKAEYLKKKAEIEAILNTPVEQKITKLEKIKNDFTDDTLNIYHTLEPKEKRALWSSIFKKITFKGGKYEFEYIFF